MAALSSIVRDAARADMVLCAGAAALLGILFHFSIVAIEFEQIMFHFMAISTISFFAILFILFDLGGHTLASAFVHTCTFLISFNAGLLFSISIYRLLFHRCRKFPGPFPAKLTRFYATSLAAKNVQYYKEAARMHATYGDFVRTGPREVSILRKSAVDAIYGSASGCLKSTWYGQTGNDKSKTSLHMTRDYHSHKARRRAWEKGFAFKALATYEPRIKARSDALIQQFTESTGLPVDVTAWSMFFSFDVMGEVGFSKDFNNLTSGVAHPAVRAVHDHLAMLGILSTVPWFLNILGSVPGAAAEYSDFFEFCASEIRSKEREWDSEAYPRDIVSWLLKAVKDKDPGASPSREALEDDSRVLIIAGSETTGTTLAGALYYMAKCPEKQRKLQRLVDEVVPRYNAWSYEKIKSVSYIDDFIHETLRLRPGLLSGGHRETPAEGIQIDDTYIPGKTNVLIPVHRIHRDPRWWPQAEEFVPERFGEKAAEFGTDNAPYLPFSLGAVQCPGKNLAQMSLRISLSAIASNFDVSFAPGEDGVQFDTEVLDTFVTTPPPLKLNFRLRRKS